MVRASTVLAVTRRYTIKPSSIDDVCYTVYNMFKDTASSIAYEKPFCTHMFVVGNSYEIRMFLSNYGEVHLTVATSFGEPRSRLSLDTVLKMFSSIDNAFSKLSSSADVVRLSLRTTFRATQTCLEDIEEVLQSLGIAIISRDTYSVSNIEIEVIRGKTIGRNLRQHEVTVTTLLDEHDVEVSLLAETPVESGDVMSYLAELQNLVYSIAEHLTLCRDQGTPLYAVHGLDKDLIIG